MKDLEPSNQAEFCGYYLEDKVGKQALGNQFKEARVEARKEYEELKDRDNYLITFERHFAIINGDLCIDDPNHGGLVYVPKRCILADLDFYNLDDWDEVTKDFLVEDDLCIFEGDDYDSNEDRDEGITEFLSNFSEQMMVRGLGCKIYVATDEPVEDDDLLRYERIKPEDVDECSSWHDG